MKWIRRCRGSAREPHETELKENHFGRRPCLDLFDAVPGCTRLAKDLASH